MKKILKRPSCRSTPVVGQTLKEKFQKERLLSTQTKSLHIIKDNKYMSFSKAKKIAATVTKSGAVLNIEVNRNILSALVSHQVKSGRQFDLKEVLQDPLTPTPLSIQ